MENIFWQMWVFRETEKFLGNDNLSWCRSRSFFMSVKDLRKVPTRQMGINSFKSMAQVSDEVFDEQRTRNSPGYVFLEEATFATLSIRPSPKAFNTGLN